MGNFIGNVLALIFIGVSVALGFVSLNVSIWTFLVIAYGAFLFLYTQAFFLGRLISVELKSMLTVSELEAYKTYNVHIRVPSAGELISTFLNLMRIAGVVYAGLAFFSEFYWEGGLAGALFFVTGSMCLRNDPVRYMSRKAGRGDDFTRYQLLNISRVSKKRSEYLNRL